MRRLGVAAVKASKNQPEEKEGSYCKAEYLLETLEPAQGTVR
jgi:hypothetical protein